jgi:multiple sugar transport system ATP-binding protein
MASIVLQGIRKSYDGREIIKGLDLSIASGEFMVFVGPSGCGKSTLLRMIAGLEEITAGDLLVDGVRVNDTAPSKRGGAMVFQNYALYPHMTVARNLGFALEVAGKSKREIREAVGWAAEILNISHLLEVLPKALSGGERQRVAIGRAIVRRPQFFLFDEPLSNLDASLRVQLRIELLRLHQELNTTMIYVTHDQVEAMTMGDRIALFRKGILEQAGDPLSMYLHPRNTFVAGFLGSPAINLLECTYQSPDQILVQGTHVLRTSAPLPAEPGCMAWVGFRPENVSLGEAGGLAGEIVLTEHLGDQVIVHVEIPGSPKLLTAKLPASTERLVKGQPVRLIPDLGKALYFDSEGKNLRAHDQAAPGV